MKNFVLGVIVGIAVAVCGYKPYQIEMEYRRNIAAGLETQSLIRCYNQGATFSCIEAMRPVPGE